MWVEQEGLRTSPLPDMKSGRGQDVYLDLGDAAGPCTEMCLEREEEIWGPLWRAYAGLPAATGSRVFLHPTGSLNYSAHASCLT